MKYFILALLISVPSFACQSGWEGTNCKQEVGHTYMPKGQGEDSTKTRQIVKAYEREVKAGRMAERTNLALDALIRYAAFKLKLQGNKEEADKLIAEWESGFNRMLITRGLGDHAPLSQWLAEKYAILELILGEKVMHAVRLDDIKTVNYAIPVVFRCIDDVDVHEFEAHFVPLSGVAMYWSSFIACTGGTWGSGFLYCAPVAMGVEWLTESFAAPRLNPWVHKRSCN